MRGQSKEHNRVTGILSANATQAPCASNKGCIMHRNANVHRKIQVLCAAECVGISSWLLLHAVGARISCEHEARQALGAFYLIKPL